MLWALKGQFCKIVKTSFNLYPLLYCLTHYCYKTRLFSCRQVTILNIIYIRSYIDTIVVNNWLSWFCDIKRRIRGTVIRSALYKGRFHKLDTLNLAVRQHHF